MNPATELTLHVPPDAVTWAYRRASGEVVVYVVQGGKTGEYRRVEVTPEPRARRRLRGGNEWPARMLVRGGNMSAAEHIPDATKKAVASHRYEWATYHWSWWRYIVWCWKHRRA